MVTIGLFAPSGYLSEPSRLERLQAHFAQHGCRAKIDPQSLGRWQRFGGTDTERLSALYRLVDDPEVDVIMPVRGGYGLSRLLGEIDWQRLAASGKIFCGHSDFSALSLALLSQTGLPSLSGPMGTDFLGESLHPAMSQAFWPMLAAKPISQQLVVYEPCINGTQGVFSGVLWGGNLSMLVHLLGTPYFPRVSGGFLFLEDINEHPYRVERMLWQLLHAGVLAEQKALILGDFSGYRLTDLDKDYSLNSAFTAIADKLTIPVLTGLPLGHIPQKITLPVGSPANLSVQANGYQVQFSFALLDSSSTTCV